MHDQMVQANPAQKLGSHDQRRWAKQANRLQSVGEADEQDIGEGMAILDGEHIHDQMVQANPAQKLGSHDEQMRFKSLPKMGLVYLDVEVDEAELGQMCV